MKKITIEMYDHEYRRFCEFPGQSDKEKFFKAMVVAYDVFRRAGELVKAQRKKHSLIWTPPGSDTEGMS